MGLKDTSESTMIFAPQANRKRRLQLRLSERRLVMIFGDVLAIITAIFIALAIWTLVDPLLSYDVDFIVSQAMWFFVLTGLWMLLANANGYYEFSIAADRWASLQRLILIKFQLVLIYVFVFFFAQRNFLPRLFILYYTLLSIPLLFIWRLFNPALLGWAATERRVLVVGTDWAAETIISILRDYAAHAYRVIGVISEDTTHEQAVAGVPIKGAGHDLVDVVKSENITEIIVTSTRELPGDVFQAVMDAYELGVTITPMPILYERVTERVPVEHVGDNWAVVLPISGTSFFNPYPLLKRFFDVAISLLGLIIFLLILPFIAIAIYINSPGSIFYSQMRVGLNGRLFRIYKLRSMKPDAENETGAIFAQEKDPRITRVGEFMRKTRLDELPQLWNILKGDMSLIGPRPERPEHIERLQEKIPFYRTRHTVQPGLTGWAQVRYSYGADDEDALVKLQYDLYYIRHQSLLLDFSILLRTVGRVLRMSGQ